jgi:hypothetical protein
VFWLIVAFTGAKMRQHSNLAKGTAEKVVKDIRWATRKQYSAEEKIRIVLETSRVTSTMMRQNLGRFVLIALS